MSYRYSNVTPQQKIESVTSKLGIPGIKKQQGTTRVIYDSLPLVPGQTSYRFFEGSNSRVFPNTNLGSFGNKLEVGESFTIQYMYFSIFTYNNLDPFELQSTSNLSAEVELRDAEVNFAIGNVQVIKPTPVISMDPAFNKGTNSASNLFFLDTDIVIPPLLEFIAEMRANITPNVNPFSRIRLTCEGVGSLINTRQTY